MFSRGAHKQRCTVRVQYSTSKRQDHNTNDAKKEVNMSSGMNVSEGARTWHGECTVLRVVRCFTNGLGRRCHPEDHLKSNADPAELLSQSEPILPCRRCHSKGSAGFAILKIVSKATPTPPSHLMKIILFCSAGVCNLTPIESGGIIVWSSRRLI